MSEILELEQLSVHFQVSRGMFRRPSTLRAVERIDLSLRNRETLGLVGESGCGKSTLGRAIVGLVQPTAGRIDFRNGAAGRAGRRKVQMVFQDPFSSLDPRQTIGSALREPLDIHAIGDSAERSGMVSRMLAMVGLKPEYGSRYPHEFSGGQRQRIGIARALIAAPELVVCDEPVSALDVSVQAQIVGLLRELKEKLDLTYLFIAHDLGIVRYISDRVAVMYLGRIVEIGPSRVVFSKPLHPYTQALVSAVPIPDPDLERRRKRIILSGEVPSPLMPPSGCRFRTRCKYAKPLCADVEPEPVAVAPDRSVSCHFWKEIEA